MYICSLASIKKKTRYYQIKKEGEKHMLDQRDTKIYTSNHILSIFYFIIIFIKKCYLLERHQNMAYCPVIICLWSCLLRIYNYLSLNKFTHFSTKCMFWPSVIMCLSLWNRLFGSNPTRYLHPNTQNLCIKFFTS